MRPIPLSLGLGPVVLLLILACARPAFAGVSVSVTTPYNGATVSTSFTLQANASSPYGVTGWRIYVDGSTAWGTAGPTSFISAPLSVSAGSHSIVVRTWDNSGAYGSVTLGVTASASTSSTSTSTSGVSVSVQSPGNGASVANPVNFTASASSPNGISGWVIYSDDQNVYQVDSYSNSLSASVNLPSGTHTIYIRAWDKVSGYGTSPKFSITVSGSSSLPTPPSYATWITAIEDLSNWNSCSDCAGGGSTTTNYWTAAYQTSPSLDGSSREFFNGGGGWANVLWYKPLGSYSSASNFLWDFYVYFDASGANNLWTAEFDLYQALNGVELMMGSQCNFGDGEWDTWNQATGQWIKTSIPCPRFAANTWHRIQWYMQRVGSNQYRYVTLVVDGTAHSINQTYSGNWCGWNNVVGVQWQLDLNWTGYDAHMWVDKATLALW